MSRQSWYRHALPLAVMASLALPALASAQGIQSHVPVSTTLGDIARLRNAYVDAFNARNATAVTAMYTPDAIVLGADGTQTAGIRAIGKLYADSASTWQKASVRSTSVKLYGATAVDVGTWTVQAPGGGEVVSRYLAVLRHGVNGWKLQHVAIVPQAR